MFIKSHEINMFPSGSKQLSKKVLPQIIPQSHFLEGMAGSMGAQYMSTHGTYMGVSIHGGTPSHHPFRHDINMFHRPLK